LEPFRVATNIIQKDSSTVYDISRQLSILLKHSEQMVDLFDERMRTHIKFCIQTEWEKHVNQDVTIAAAILSCSPNLTRTFTGLQIRKAQDFIITWGKSYLEFYQFTEVENIESELTEQFLEFSGRNGRFDGFETRLNVVKSRARTDAASDPIFAGLNSKEQEDRVSFDPKVAWSSYLLVSPELTYTAMAILVICGSEASVERSFSLQDRVHNKLRNQSKDDLVEAQVFIKFNERVLCNTFECTISGPVEITMDCNENSMDPVLFDFSTNSNSVHQPHELQQKPIASESNADVVRESDQESNCDESDNATEEKITIPIANDEEVLIFVKKFVEENKLTKSSRLFGDRENNLINAQNLSSPRVITTLVAMKKLIKYIAPESRSAPSILRFQ
jgi:hypothetical protein